MRWSKNINEERDAPEQIIIGSMDPKMCVLLNLAVHIESTSNIVSSEFVYGNPKDGDRVVRRCLTNMVKNDAFKKLKTGKLGTHSLRKGAATYATRSGVSKDFVNRRGRWRTRKGVVDIYIDNTQPYPDALTAATLAGPAGPCFYNLRTGVGCVSTNFLVDQIAPTVKQLMGESIAATLALPLLWAAMEPSENYDYALLPNKLQQRILRAFTNVAETPGLNPVVREGIYVTDDGSQLNLVIMENSECSGQKNNAATTHPGGNVGGGEVAHREFAALHAQIAAVRQHTTDEVQQLRRDFQRELQKLQTIFRRVAMYPAVRHDISAHDPPVEDLPGTRRVLTARLSKRPKDLYELWHEYQVGCGDLKAAKEFTTVERGANKFAYSRRKVFWDVVSSLVRSGFTSETAIDKVYSVYGRQLSVSNILVALRADRKRGRHPGLQPRLKLAGHN
ncbi:hypothetical protein PHMEG_00026389 [Phytophthora megakarya]|uniref:Uncharacterized protein n=1 Tax=Phytophthora megakarya TaxID=4795 RepID=A0A225VB37_9STRA|nr:hypothetical protein PHMEG_00026389 [Phytophthora megakarya]